MDFRATRHGHNCEPGPHSSDRTVSICSDVADDLLSTNQNYLVSVFAQRKVFPDDGLISNQSILIKRFLLVILKLIFNPSMISK